MKANEATHFADLLASASSSSNTNVAMMGQTFQYVAPVMGALGYSADDAALAIGLMANAGIKGSKGRYRAQIVYHPFNQTLLKKHANVMQQLGISITDASGEMLPFRDLMAQLRERFAGLLRSRKHKPQRRYWAGSYVWYVGDY